MLPGSGIWHIEPLCHTSHFQSQMVAQVTKNHSLFFKLNIYLLEICYNHDASDQWQLEDQGWGWCAVMTTITFCQANSINCWKAWGFVILKIWHFSLPWSLEEHSLIRGWGWQVFQRDVWKIFDLPPSPVRIAKMFDPSGVPNYFESPIWKQLLIVIMGCGSGK